MGSILSFSVLLSLALSVSAAPCEQNIFANPNIKVKFTEEIVMPEANAGLYLCDSAGFVGHCVHYTTEFGHCSELIQPWPQSIAHDLRTYLIDSYNYRSIPPWLPRCQVCWFRSRKLVYPVLVSFTRPVPEPVVPLLNLLLFGRQTHCHGDELQIHYPGVDDLSKKNWSNKVRSYNCAAE